MAVLPKLIYRFNAISIKISVGIFVEIDKTILTIIWKFKETRIDKTILGGKKENNIGCLTLPISSLIKGYSDDHYSFVLV